jgi:hypothetical protein
MPVPERERGEKREEKVRLYKEKYSIMGFPRRIP